MTQTAMAASRVGVAGHESTASSPWRAGTVLFAGTWPLFNSVAAVAVNGAVLAAIFVLGWSAEPAGS